MLLDPDLFKVIWLSIAGLAGVATAVLVGATSIGLLIVLRSVRIHGWRRVATNKASRLWVQRHDDQPPHDVLLDGGNYLEPPPNFPF